MENCWDFLQWLGPDASTCVFASLDDPSDLVRASAVSRSWRRFVIANGFSRSLCRRICPEVSNFTRAVEVSSSAMNQEVGSSTAVEWESLVREHRIYSYLCRCLVSPEGSSDCIDRCIGASSTDNFPDESIENTLEPSDRVYMRPSYWSSGGEADPQVPESLIYRLGSDLCVVNEIKIQPFKGQSLDFLTFANTYLLCGHVLVKIFFLFVCSAFFQHGDPIYSVKFVRFRMGNSKLPLRSENYVTDENEGQAAADDNFVWTYISPEFPMLQESVLQSFKLPRPVLCIGGVVKIELLGRVQKQAMDGLYYICVSHVQVLGRPLSPKLALDTSEASGASVLKYFPVDSSSVAPNGASRDDEAREPSRWHAFAATLRHLRAGGAWNQAILNTLLRPVQFAEEDDDSDEEEPYA
ncbi:F-box protein At4g00755 isoform X2 [Ananas comosus]|nr:F-box protein At4g00755 isoform X2 [Ananas comosus]XP_020084390.1 F-box protein At4g00755 isoform X2 [Ananas comosus]